MAVKKAPVKGVKEMPEPLEADDRRYRRPVRPTRARIEKKPTAVVMLSWVPSLYGENWDDLADRDFMHVSATRMHDVNGKQMSEADIFFMANDMFAKSDVEQFGGDIRHGTIMVTNTNPDQLTFGRIELRGGTAKWRVAVREALLANPTIIFSKSQHERIEEEAAAPKPRKKNAGAINADAPKRPTRAKRAAVAVADAQEAPKPRVRRKRNADAPVGA